MLYINIDFQIYIFPYFHNHSIVFQNVFAKQVINFKSMTNHLFVN